MDSRTTADQESEGRLKREVSRRFKKKMKKKYIGKGGKKMVHSCDSDYCDEC